MLTPLYECKKSEFNELFEYLCNYAHALEIKSSLHMFEIAEKSIIRVMTTEYSLYSLDDFMSDNDNFIICDDKALLDKIDNLIRLNQYAIVELYQ